MRVPRSWTVDKCPPTSLLLMLFITSAVKHPKRREWNEQSLFIKDVCVVFEGNKLANACESASISTYFEIKVARAATTVDQSTCAVFSHFVYKAGSSVAADQFIFTWPHHILPKNTFEIFQMEILSISSGRIWSHSCFTFILGSVLFSFSAFVRFYMQVTERRFWDPRGWMERRLYSLRMTRLHNRTVSLRQRSCRFLPPPLLVTELPGVCCTLVCVVAVAFLAWCPERIHPYPHPQPSIPA